MMTIHLTKEGKFHAQVRIQDETESCGIIHLTKEGKFHAQVRIQDGTESCGIHDSYADAVEACFHGMKVLNGHKRNEPNSFLKESKIDAMLPALPLPYRYRLRWWLKSRWLVCVSPTEGYWSDVEMATTYWTDTVNNLNQFLNATADWSAETLFDAPFAQIAIEQLEVKLVAGEPLSRYIQTSIGNRSPKALETELQELEKRRSEIKAELKKLSKPEPSRKPMTRFGRGIKL